MLSPDDLVVSHFTVARLNRAGEARAGFAERVAAAAYAGYAGIVMMPNEYRHCRALGLSDAEMKRILADYGMVVGEVDALSDWAADPDLPERREAVDLVMAMADVFGPRSITVADIRPPGSLPPREVMVERLARLADRAAERNAVIALEFFPWGEIRDAAYAWDLVRGTGRRNAGVLIDFWHHSCGSNDDDLIRAIPSEHIVAVQITDGDPDPSITDGLRQTQMGRRFPGQGVLPVERLLRLLDELGVRVPKVVEAVSPLPEHRRLSSRALARISYETTRRAIAAARRSPEKVT